MLAEDDSSQSDIREARRILDQLRRSYTRGDASIVIDPAQFNNWSLNLMESERLEAKDEPGRLKALEDHKERLASLNQQLKALAEQGKVSSNSCPDSNPTSRVPIGWLPGPKRTSRREPPPDVE